jgi:tricarballylate dehydrogenase
MAKIDADVIVVGAGNAALCAALAAREHGASVIALEAAPEEESGGNSRYTAGLYRIPYDGMEELEQIIPDLSDDEKENTDFGRYTKDDFFDDMARVTQYRANPDLVEIMVTRAHETGVWMRTKGVRFLPAYGRQAFKHEGKFKFWGGAHIEAAGGGPGLVESLMKGAAANDIEVRFETRASGLVTEDGRVVGVEVRSAGKSETLYAKTVVLACGGFEANSEWRTRCLGPGWDLAKVRGTRFNMGDGIKMALDIGAMPYGNWSGAHSVGWDRNAPEFGDLEVGDNFQKHSYPFGIIVNANGDRFVDEGADFRNYTYVRYGRAVLEQPGHFAWQIFDSKVTHLLRDEYRIRQITKVQADTLEELSTKLDDVDPAAFLKTVEEFNTGVTTDVTFNPNVKDGRSSTSNGIPKSNWANQLDTPPYEAYAITCGVTFTFGGLRIDQTGAVMDTAHRPIPGLYAAGELVGGLFYFNYPGGSGLVSGSVFGRLAGNSAGQEAAAG